MYQQIPCTIQNINKKIFVVALQPLFLPSEKRISSLNTIAEVAHLVEHDLAKVGVAGSSPVFRSKLSRLVGIFFLYQILFNENVYSGGGTGRHAGLKILFTVM